MPIIHLETIIKADMQVVFDLSRSIDFHKFTTEHTKEEAIDGVTKGLIGLNETVTWRAKHLGFYQVLKSKITEFDESHSFTDVMVKGIFKSLEHKHIFLKLEGSVKMIDYFEYVSPLGVLGKMADFIFLKNYLTKFIEKRNQQIKECAESECWKSILEYK